MTMQSLPDDTKNVENTNEGDSVSCETVRMSNKSAKMDNDKKVVVDFIKKYKNKFAFDASAETDVKKQLQDFVDSHAILSYYKDKVKFTTDQVKFTKDQVKCMADQLNMSDDEFEKLCNALNPVGER